MTSTVPGILARIVEHKRLSLEAVRSHMDVWETRAETRLKERRDFRSALASHPPSIIAEIKQASPSKGTLTTTFDPAIQAQEYTAGGAAALSILTDEEFFRGSLRDLELARRCTSIPVLRKDFTIEACQIAEAAAHGADAILLIAAILNVRQLRELRETAARWKMAALVEVHSADELSAAIDCGADLVGVNNRNLDTFEVDLGLSERLAAKMPANAVRVSESGISTHGDVARLMDCGYHAFLVGEHLMRSSDPAAAIRTLRG